jgi:hypothetical protein
MRRTAALVLALAVVAAACGGDGTLPDGSLGVRANAELSVGQERILVGIVGPDGERLGDPDTPITLQLAPAEVPEAVLTLPAEFIWIVPNAFGLYKADVAFGQAGTWEAVAIADDGSRTEPMLFSVLEEGFAPRVGELAPRVETPTAAEFDIASISTDPDPDPAFYELSLDEALDNGKPTVIVFSTPRFCDTSACGPLLDQVKEVAANRSDVDFVHVEIYENFDDPDFDPDAIEFLAPAVLADGYNLVSEPWVFVTDAHGVITARFEGVASDDELKAAVQ